MPVVITFTVGICLILARFIPQPPFPAIDSNFSVYFDIIAVFAFILGAGNLLKVHGNRIYHKRKDWRFSIVTILGFFFTLVVGLGKLGGPPGLQGDTLAEGSLFRFCFDAMYNPLAATMFALLAFFVASAAYRAFRAKTVEATILLAAAFIILLGRTFMGHYASGWVLTLPSAFHFLYIPNLANWILSWPNTAGQRAIMIGIALGVISTSLRLILGIERGYLGGKE